MILSLFSLQPYRGSFDIWQWISVQISQSCKATQSEAIPSSPCAQQVNVDNLPFVVAASFEETRVVLLGDN